jgi:hypothetical protein
VFYPTARVKGPQLLSRRVRRGNSTNVLSGLRGFRVGMFWVPSTDEDKRSLCDIITVIIGIVSTPVPGTTSPAWTAGACPHIEILIFISLPLEHFLKPCLLLFFCCVQKIVDCLSIGQLLSAARQLLERATVLLPFDTVLLQYDVCISESLSHTTLSTPANRVTKHLQQNQSASPPLSWVEGITPRAGDQTTHFHR